MRYFPARMEDESPGSLRLIDGRNHEMLSRRMEGIGIRQLCLDVSRRLGFLRAESVAQYGHQLRMGRNELNCSRDKAFPNLYFHALVDPS